jgi:hypothetical protein
MRRIFRSALNEWKRNSFLEISSASIHVSNDSFSGVLAYAFRIEVAPYLRATAEMPVKKLFET